MKKVFLDSSVFFSAVNSPTGGSAKLFILKNIHIVTSKLVLTEVERNVRKKLLEYHLERFFVLVEKIKIMNLPPEVDLIKKAEKVIVKKDATILSQNKQAESNYLVTLDKKHFLQNEVHQFIAPTRVLTPKDLLQILKKV
ncbi:putative toxin-antitoxin system toxin component, PIN family [Candidatus Roizmanbacteria bacterium]|nr:putative toxin-antitoxin system toxin component, PIN family [Candidatus Roizmanbacteria bacterium]